jgi:large subunit ribosomal protein L24
VKIQRGDRVRVLTGKDRGKQGEVTRVLPSKTQVFVDGVNIAKRHTKPRQANTQGGIIDKRMPINVSNVAIICSQCGPTRIGYSHNSDGIKIRICRKCGGDL